MIFQILIDYIIFQILPDYIELSLSHDLDSMYTYNIKKVLFYRNWFINVDQYLYSWVLCMQIIDP